MAYTCACNAVRDHQVREVIDAGATSIEDVADACGAGTDCGGCLPTVEALLALADAADPTSALGSHASA